MYMPTYVVIHFTLTSVLAAQCKENMWRQKIGEKCKMDDEIFKTLRETSASRSAMGQKCSVPRRLPAYQR